MKFQHYIHILLLTACLTISLSTTAQHKTVVYGKLGVSNVNISLGDNSHGTSTDAMGRYALTLYDRTKDVSLFYSCIGYQDTVVSLSPRQLQCDSINVSFKLKKQNYNLQEVTVTAKHKLFGEKYFYLDFEVFDHTICILAACPNKNLRCLIMADETLHGLDTIHLPAHIKP